MLVLLDPLVKVECGQPSCLRHRFSPRCVQSERRRQVRPTSIPKTPIAVRKSWPWDFGRCEPRPGRLLATRLKCSPGAGTTAVGLSRRTTDVVGRQPLDPERTRHCFALDLGFNN